MDALVMELNDMVEALRAENRRLRGAAQHVIDKSHFTDTEDLMDLDRALRSLQRELDRIAPSMAPKSKKAAGRRH